VKFDAVSNTSMSDINVLEFSGEVGGYAGKLFADLGANVIHVELPGGDPDRYSRPFYSNVPNKEGSLRYLYLNTNKRGLVLDITTEKGREVLLRLIDNTDVLLEDFPPGYMDKLGVGYGRLSRINPKLVYTAITPFGKDGPYKDRLPSDMVCSAMGGFLYLAGIGDDKPSRAYGDQAYMMASQYAAMGSMIALYHAEETGEGQFVDVSIQACVTTALENAAQYYDLEKIIRRSSGGLEAGYGTYPCKDGYVYIMAAMGKNRYLWDPFVHWLIDEKVEGAELLLRDEWAEPAHRKKEESKEMFNKIFLPFALNRNKMYLYEESQRRKCCVFPVSNPKDIYENPQLQYRQFFKTLRHDSLNAEIHYPGAPYETEKLKWQLNRPAPAFGQDTIEILKELSYSAEEINSLLEGGVAIGKETA